MTFEKKVSPNAANELLKGNDDKVCFIVLSTDTIVARDSVYYDLNAI